MAAVDYFLELDGIKGESSDDKHKDTIEIDSFSWGATNQGISSSGGGGGTGKVSFQDLVIKKEVDKASPLLMLACASGQHIKKAVLYVRKSGGQQLDYYTVTLEDVLVSHFESDGMLDGASPIPSEQLSLNYAKIKFEYKPQKSDGSLDSTVSSGWDIKANKKA